MPRDLVAIDKMKYKKDSLAFALCIFGLLANVLYFFTLYRNNDNHYYTYQMGISVIYNLLFMLIVFLSAEEVKAYQRRYSYVLFVLGVIQIFRIFYIPKQAYDAEIMTAQNYRTLSIYLIISSVFLILAAVRSFWNSTLLKRYIESNLKIPPTEEV
ncbi:MAG TPA: hypothetical protein GX692_04565 [Acholeplasmataceae bacterium]|jgi:hypothetical protein|nr:hypothetical protein [Acholeplasmataceae bacterium]